MRSCHSEGSEPLEPLGGRHTRDQKLELVVVQPRHGDEGSLTLLPMFELLGRNRQVHRAELTGEETLDLNVHAAPPLEFIDFFAGDRRDPVRIAYVGQR